MANTYTLAPNVFQQWFDDDGNPADGGLIFTYAAGTSTKLATYTSSDGSVAQTNPIVLNSAGRPPSDIYLQPLSYKLVRAAAGDTDPPASPLQTEDNVAAVPFLNTQIDIPGTSGEILTTNDLVYLSAGDGSRTAGRWYKADSDIVYGSIGARTLGFVLNTVGAQGQAITIRVAGRMTGLSGLTSGTLYYVSATAGQLTATMPQNPRRIGQADSTTTLVMRVDLPAETYRLIYSARTGTGSSGAGETTLNSITLDASLLDVGRILRIRAWGTSAANANAKTIKLYIGTLTITLLSASTALNNRQWTVDGDIFITGTNAALLNGRFTADTTTVPTFTTSASSALTLTNTQLVKITGQGTTTNDLVDNGMVVELLTPLTF